MPRKIDVLQLHRDHVIAKENRNRYAYRAKEMHEAGKREQAKRALQKADYWEAKRKAIENKYDAQKTPKG